MATAAPLADSKLPTSTPAPSAASGSRRRLVAFAVLITLAVAGTAYWLYSRQFEDTDDAQVEGNVTNVSPRLTGYVTAVHVLENQAVKEGDILAEIDPSDLKIAVDLAKAQVAEAEAQLQAEDPSVSITVATNTSALASAQSDLAAAQAALSAARKEVAQLTAQLVQAEANDRTAQLEKARSEKLIAQGAIAQSDYDLRMNEAAASAANIDALRQSLAAARDRVAQQQAVINTLQSHFSEVKSNAPQQIATRKASVAWRRAELDAAKAQLAQAQRNLGYSQIVSPVTGIVAKKSLAVGDYVAPGQQILAIAQTQELWVTANFRETQLERMTPGQPVTVHVDALDITLHGSVESLGGATGSRLSVLPPENATGNYVKVVQRIPVHIRLDPGQPGLDRLRIGMSVGPRVRVQ